MFLTDLSPSYSLKIKLIRKCHPIDNFDFGNFLSAYERIGSTKTPCDEIVVVNIYTKSMCMKCILQNCK